MPRIFTGPVELSEVPTASHKPQFIGTTLRLEFQVTKIAADPNQGTFPKFIVGTKRVQTYQEWQQHAVWLNGHLIGTIDKYCSDSDRFEFAFQPRVLKEDLKPHVPHEMPLALVNELVIQLGTGGFGLNDSFDIEYIDVENFTTNLG